MVFLCLGYEIFQKLKTNIKVRKTSVDAAIEFQDKTLDAVYIDAEHDPISVRSDINSWKNKIKYKSLKDYMHRFDYLILTPPSKATTLNFKN